MKALASAVWVWVGVLLTTSVAFAQEDGRAATGNAAPSGGFRMVFLHSGANCTLGNRDAIFRAPPLMRELARQALLIAAREELGLPARDEFMGDLPKKADGLLPIQISFEGEGIESIRIRCAPAGNYEIARKEAIPLDRPMPYASFAVEMEAESRTGFVEILKKAGCQATGDVTKRAAEGRGGDVEAALKKVVASIESQLADLSIFSHFSALRETHAAIRGHGESPELLGLLVRGYGQLGMLCEWNCHSMHKAMKARALLYAQRNVAKFAETSLALDHKAFALAMAGLPAATLECLAAADAKGDDARAPWVELLKAYCHFDSETLQAAAKVESHKSLADLLAFVALEGSGCNFLTIEQGKRVVRHSPECYRVVESVAYRSGIGLGHKTTVFGSQTLAETFRTRMGKLSGLPAATARLVKRDDPTETDPDERMATSEEISQVIKGLLLTSRPLQIVKGGTRPGESDEEIRKRLITIPPPPEDNNGMRWEALGLMLREITWMHCRCRAHFERNRLGVQAEEWIDRTKPLWSIHPFAPVLLTFSWQLEEVEKASEAVSRLNTYPAGVAGANVAISIRHTRKSDADRLMGVAVSLRDDTVEDLNFILGRWGRADGKNKQLADHLLLIAPECPHIQSIFVAERRDDLNDEKVAAWEKVAERYPLLAMELGNYAAFKGEKEKAEKWLKVAARNSHERFAYQALAEFYKANNGDDQWLATMQAYLKEPDEGLEHSVVQIAIADYYSENGAYEKALPFAEAAAATYSGTGLLAAAKCHEGLQNWDRADEYYSALSKRYRGHNHYWYFFCKRTGKGNSSEARKTMLEYVTEAEGTRLEAAWMFGDFYLLEREPEDALRYHELEANKAGDPYYKLMVAFAHHEAKRAEQCKEALEHIVEHGTEFKVGKEQLPRVEIIELAKVLLADLAKDGKGDFEIADAEKVIPEDVGHIPPCHVHYFLGRYLDDCGKKEEAIAQWKKCMACPVIILEARTLAGEALIMNKVTPEDYANPLVPE